MTYSGIVSADPEFSDPAVNFVHNTMDPNNPVLFWEEISIQPNDSIFIELEFVKTP